MAESQHHGLEIEKLVVQSGVFPGFRGEENYTADADIPSKYDPMNLPTHIKSLQYTRPVDMSDARRFWSITEPARLLLFGWEQITNFEKRSYM